MEFFLRKNTESLSLENNVQDLIRKPKLTYLASNFLFYYICLAYVSNKFNFCTRASEIQHALLVQLGYPCTYINILPPHFDVLYFSIISYYYLLYYFLIDRPIFIRFTHVSRYVGIHFPT